VDAALLVVIAVLLAFGCYALWDTSLLRAEASSERWEPYRPVSEGEEGTAGTGTDATRASFSGDGASGAPSFASLCATNPEVIGWLNLYDTNIDYPVTQAESNMKYVNTDAMGAYSAAGSLFLDAGSAADLLDFSSIIYGHHMEGDVLFGGLSRFADPAYLEAHRYGRLYADGRWQGLEALAFMRVDAYDGAVYRTGTMAHEDRAAYLETLSARALHVRGGRWPDGLTDGHLVLLSTCSSGITNGRDILVCALTDTVALDPSAVRDGAGSGAGAGIFGGSAPLDAVVSAWRGLPLWAKVASALVLATLVCAAVWIWRRRRRRRDG
jgi:sortase B